MKRRSRGKTYTPDPEEFAAWLECGLDAFKSRQNNKTSTPEEDQQ
jgi:hypothetical protein